MNNVLTVEKRNVLSLMLGQSEPTWGFHSMSLTKVNTDGFHFIVCEISTINIAFMTH